MNEKVFSIIYPNGRWVYRFKPGTMLRMLKCHDDLKVMIFSNKSIILIRTKSTYAGRGKSRVRTEKCYYIDSIRNLRYESFEENLKNLGDNGLISVIKISSIFCLT